MAMQSGVSSSSKVLILVGAGLTGSILLKSGRLSDVVLQLQELLKGVDVAEISPNKYDATLLAAQIRQLAQEIKELSMSNPVTIFNGSSSSSGGYGSYLVPAAAVGAMGYCYMWWKGLSFSDVMFVTKQNMASAVASVSKQLENVSEALVSTKRHLSKKLETLDWKVEEQKETSKLILNDVTEVKSNLSEIGFDIESIRQMICGLEGKLELLESRQDMTNSGLWYLCQVAGGIKDGLNSRLFQDVGSKVPEPPKITMEKNPMKGLQFIVESRALDNPVIATKNDDDHLEPTFVKSTSHTKARIHRSFPVGLSLARDIFGS